MVDELAALCIKVHFLLLLRVNSGSISDDWLRICGDTEISKLSSGIYCGSL